MVFLVAVTFFKACERLVIVSSFFRHSAHGFDGSAGDGCFSVSPKSQSDDTLHLVQTVIMKFIDGFRSPLV